MPTSIAQVHLSLVEDHQIVVEGVRNVIDREPGWVLAAAVPTVADLLRTAPHTDLTLLDLRLSDGSTVTSNVGALIAAGIKVIAFTAGDDLGMIRAAARAGVAAVVRKSDPVEVFTDVIRRVLEGESVASADWAAVIDSDAALPSAGLSPRERQVLSLYASGETAARIGDITGISVNTVSKYVGRIRTKYALVGRDADTKIALHQRASEDGLLREGSELGAP